MKLNLASLHIFGITGGIGYEFYKFAITTNCKINGFYYSNDKLANKIKAPTFKIDLSEPNNITNFNFNNFEGILYVPGQPFFADTIFPITNQNIIKQININLTSLIVIINSLLNIKNSNLRKIVIVASKISKNKSIYHLSKYLQENLFYFINNELSKKDISVSIIRTGWVNTNMMSKYIEEKNQKPLSFHEASTIACECLKQFNESKPLNVVEL